jgi:hypothetical protein
VVEVRFTHGAVAGAEALRAAGGRIISLRRRYQTATVAALPADLRTLAAAPRVTSVVEVLTPLARSACPSGEVVSEGFEQLRVDEVGSLFPGIDGSDVEVGVLSDSFDKATEAAEGGPLASKEKEDVEEGDLPGTGNPCEQPTKVDIVEELGGGEEAIDEGRAMAQIVHDLAPDADLSFASAFTGSEKFAENIKKLAEGGAEVIVDDVIYLTEPFFQEGPIALAAREASEEGVAYFTAAGNDNLIDSAGRDIASWEAPQFRDAGSCPASLVAFSEEFEEEIGPGANLNPSHCMDFNPGSGVDTTLGITVEPESLLIVDLQWAEPWNGVGTDLDAFLFSAGGSRLTACLEEFEGCNDNVSSQQPTEIVGFENTSSISRTVQLVINRYSGALPRLKFILVQNGEGVSGIEYPESRGGDVVGPSIFGHSGSRGAISVAAVPFNDSSEPEPYSSRGPVTHYFGPVTGTEPAAPLPSPEVLSKPDVAATDCGVTTFFAFKDLAGDWRFCGTSAAAPHAAAVAALGLEADEEATPTEIREAEVNSAAAVGAFGSCAVGGGLLDAVETLTALTSGEFGPASPACEPPESPPIPPPSPPPTTDVVEPPLAGPPATFIRKRPRKVVRTRGRRARVVFRFASDQADAFFECRIDRGRFRRCAPKLVRRLKLGRHVLRVRAVSASGAADPSPAVYRFRVRRLPPI